MQADTWSFVTRSGLFLHALRMLFTDRIFKDSYCVHLSKDMGEHLLQKHADEPLKHSTKVLKHSVKLLKHSSNFWRFKRKLKAWQRVWNAMQDICITTRPMLSKSATVIGPSCLRGCYVSFYFEKTIFFNNSVSVQSLITA